MAKVPTLRPRLSTFNYQVGSSPTAVAEESRPGSRAWERLRLTVLTRANGLCECEQCKDSRFPRRAHEVDHIIPLWAGGSNDESNLQAINVQCHRRKTDIETKRRYLGWNGRD